jgi:hypothetical protein
LFFALALLAPVYCAMFVSSLRLKPEYMLQRLAMWPHEALRMLWWGVTAMFSLPPLYSGISGIMHLLLLLACVWWFRRPRPASGLAVLAAGFLTGPSGLLILFTLGGAKVGHP